MRDRFEPLLSRVLPFWQDLGAFQRAALVFAAFATIGLASYFMMQGPQYSPLFTKLDQQDAAAIVAKLKESKVQYQLADNGTTILVPESALYETRLALAGDGLPQSGTVGMELFNQPSLGATDFVQKLNYQRALEGELGRTIGRIDGVASARVHLVMPQPTLFKEQEKPATASIVLGMKAGAALSDGEVRGITHLVATSVEGLQPENITLMDTRGRLLSSGAGDGTLGALDAASTQLQVQHAYENGVEQTVQALLDRTVGGGKGIVSSAAVLDWDKVQTVKEGYLPDQGDQPVVRSQREVVDSTTSTDGAAANGGAPGTQSNAANGYQQVGGGGGNSNTQHKETTQNYEIAKSVDTINKAPGSVKRLTVSVVLDTSIPPEQVAQLKPAIEAAVGMDAKRGDVVQIASVPFDHSMADAEAKAAEESKAQEQTQQYISLAKTFGLPALAILVIGATLLIGTRGRRREPVQALSLAGAGGPPPFETVVTEVVDDVRLPPELERRKMLREQVSTLAREDPQMVVAIVKGWMREEAR